MPEKATMRRALRARRQGKASATQAGEFVGEEMRHVKRGKHGAKSRAQAIAIGLSKARRSGVRVARRRGSAARNRRPVAGARSSRAPQRSGRRTGSRRTTSRVSARSVRSRGSRSRSR